jgi:hypothetical protein
MRALTGNKDHMEDQELLQEEEGNASDDYGRELLPFDPDDAELRGLEGGHFFDRSSCTSRTVSPIGPRAVAVSKPTI